MALVANPIGVIIEKITGTYAGVVTLNSIFPTVIWHTLSEQIGSIYDERPIDTIERISVIIPNRCLVDRLILYVI